MKRFSPVERNLWQYSEWTAPPPKRVWLWRRTASKSNLRTAIVLSPVLIMVMVVGLLAPKGGDFAGLRFFGLLPLGVLLSIIALSRLPHEKRSGTDIRDLMDLPQTVPQYPVQVDYMINETTYGKDVGVLSFTGPLLYFQGRRSHFSFSNAAVRKIVADFKHKPGMADLPYIFDGGGLTVRIQCFDSTPQIGTGFQKKFAEELDRWKRSDLHGDPTNILPPLRAESRYVSRARTATIAALAPTSLLLVVVVLYWSDFGTVLVAFLIVLLLFGGNLSKALTRMNNLKRLRAIEEDRQEPQFEAVRVASDGQLQEDPHLTLGSAPLQIHEAP